MNEGLKCPSCGVRRLVRTEVVGNDGNPYSGDWGEVYECVGCKSALKVVPDGDDKVKLEVVVKHSSILAWRAL